MSNVNIFEVASRNKLRFSVVGRFSNVTVEDLWHLSLNDLDSIAKGINAQIKASQEESFLSSKKTDATKGSELALEVVKHVITTLEAEKEARTAAKEKATKRQKLIDALADAEARETQSKTPEQLRAELAQLDEE